jgi:RND superfamily putative drug exporter
MSWKEQHMMQAWGRALARWRWPVIAAAVAGVAGAVFFGPGVFGSLSSGGFNTNGSEASRAESRIAATVGRQNIDLVAVYHSDTLTVDEPAFQQSVAHSLSALPSSDVEASFTYYSTEAPTFVSADRHSTYAAIRLSGADAAARLSTYQQVEDGLHDAGPGVDVTLGGTAAVNGQIDSQVSSDLARAEALSMPVLLVLLILVFGSAVAAGLPVLIGGMTVVGSFVLLRLLTMVTDVSVFAINIITILGLGLAIDYGLFIVSRFREELTPTTTVPDALARTMSTAGRTVLFSAVTVAVSLSSLMLFPQVFLRSMGYGGVAAIAVAASAALTVLPAVLAVLGHRVNALRVRLPRRRHRPDHDGRWERFARAVMRRPVAFATVATVLLVWLALPFLHVRFGGIDERALPEGAEARVVSETLDTRFGAPDLSPVDVIVDGADPAAVQAFVTRIEQVPGVAGIKVAARSGNTTVLAVDHVGGPVDASARAVVTGIRSLPDPDGAEVLVGGITAQNVDLRASLGTHLPIMAALVVITTFVLLFLAFGSFVLPLKAVAMNVLSLGASFGVVTWIFQEGHLSGPLHFTSTGTVETTQPILMLAILFGLSMDYEVFLLSRIREHYEQDGDNTAAVAHGLQRTGRIITSAALLLVVVIAAFSTSGITFVKLIGVGMAVAIIVDATIVRAVLVPAVMRLLGRWNWWAPAPLQRWQSRYGWTESEKIVPDRPEHELTPAGSPG